MLHSLRSRFTVYSNGLSKGTNLLVKILLGAVIAYLFALVMAWIFMPSFQQVQTVAMGSDRVLLASDGELLQTIRTDFKRRRLAWYGLNNFSTEVKNSVVEAEDQRFFYHFGFDPIGIVRALTQDLRGHSVQGASTLSMQLSDLIEPGVLVHNRPIRKGSIFHKLGQLVRAVLLERRWSKAEILEAYLNLIHLKGEVQGVPAFSYSYFDRHPLAVDRAQALVIASLISSPNQNQAALLKRACELSNRTTHQDQALGSCAELEPVVSALFARLPKMPQSPGVAPHLARRLFYDHAKATTLTSTIDHRLQLKVMELMESSMRRLKDQNVHDNAAIVIDNKSGEVLAYVGAVSTSESPFVDGAMAYRQAGSSLKPFLYGRAIDGKLLTAASILMDDPTAISWDGDVYRPANYDRHFNGAVSVREALASSLNVPAVKTATILGLKQTYEVLQSLMLTGLKSPDFYGVSMALGAVEVRLDELANAYRMMANGGEWTPLRFTKGAQSDAAETSNASNASNAFSGLGAKSNAAKQAKRLYSPEAAYIISSILSDPDARSIGFGWDTPLETSFWTAVKTGTSKDYRDNWCLGYSQFYTVGVWAGNFDSQAMEKVSGVSGVGPTWSAIMNELHRSRASVQPPAPRGIVSKEIRHSWVSRAHQEFFIKGTEPAYEVIEPSLNKRAQFVFPAEGSVLIKDPHMDQNRIALYVKFKGEIPDNSVLLMDKKLLGRALSPFKMNNPPSGDHELTLLAPDKSALTTIHFSIHGAE